MKLLITALILQCAVIAGFTGETGMAHAGTPDRYGNNAEVLSISIIPDPVPAGVNPEIIGLVHNTSSAGNGTGGDAVFDVTALVTSPTGSQQHLFWRAVRFSAGQRKLYPFGKRYAASRPGAYTVVYSVYNSGKSHLYASLTKSFSVSSPTTTRTEGPVKQPVSRAQQTIEPQPQKPSTYGRSSGKDLAERERMGIGAHVNTLNFSAGPSLILWPLKNLAIQGVYGLGTFTSYEARTFYRVPLSRRFKPYFGAGYIHAQRKTSILGVDTTIEGSSFTIFGGVELPVYKKLYAYLDLSGTPMKLRKDVVTATQQATGVVKYTPVTLSGGLVFYIF